MNTYLITGGSGYLGHGLVANLLDSPQARVRVMARGEARLAAMQYAFRDHGGAERLRTLVGDVRDYDRLLWAMRGVDYVIHAAALKRVEVGEYNTDEVMATNVDGTRNAIRAAHMTPGMVGFTFISSDKACEPLNAYGASKLCGERLTMGAHLNRAVDGPRFNAVRYGNVMGSTGSVVEVWRRQKAAGESVTITKLDATRFWMDRGDAVEWVLSHIAAPGGRIYVPSLVAFRLGDLAAAMEVPWLPPVGLGQGEKMHESLVGAHERLVADGGQIDAEYAPTTSNADGGQLSPGELRNMLRHIP